MNIREGDTVECLHHMSNRGKVVKVYYVPVTAGNGAGAFTKRLMIVFESEMDGKTYNMRAQDLRKVRE